MSGLKLILFDMDGTLIDSQGQIIASMRLCFQGAGMVPPKDDEIRAIVGLSLPQAIQQLAPWLNGAKLDQMVEAYKSAFTSVRQTGPVAEASPMFPGAREALVRLGAVDEYLLGVATGKSRRGLTHVFDGHALHPFFVTTQVADDHPSKPHPSMVLEAMAQTGVGARDTVVVGDTSFDIEMGRNAGVGTIGVSWGYHPVSALEKAGAHRIISDYAQLDAALCDLWSKS
ncbi:MAG: HAD-IA family hydrolase [Brevirhabdus sp.]